MKSSNSAQYVISVSAAVVLLAGCTSSGGSQLAPVGGNHKVDLSLTRVTPNIVKPKFERKIRDMASVKPNCCGLQKTLAVTDAFGGSSFNGAVFLFDYNTGAALGSLAPPPGGWQEPQGACTDKSGNFYFVNTNTGTIDEYSHNGAYIAQIADPGQFPVGCAGDRSTGNLAVSNIIDYSGGPGSISIYSGGVLQNTYYPINMSRVYFLGYEAGTGVLWLSGSGSTGGFQVDTFSSGEFHIVPVSGIQFPGTVQWSAKTKTMVLGDQDTFSAPTFYQVDDSGNIVGATVTRCTQSTDLCDIVQAVIKGPGLVGPDASLITANRFAFPAGGAPTLNYGGAPYVQPLGSAVSPDKSSGDEPF